MRKMGLALILLVGGGVFAGYAALAEPGPAPLAEAVLRRGIAETGAQNFVTAIYLNYRLFDTLLEALLLLVSVIGVSQFARLSGSERNHPNVNRPPEHARRQAASPIMAGSLGPVYLLIALFGIYVIVTGMDGPGGGFQGGAILAAIVISANFAEGRQLLRLDTAEKLEKLLYVLLIGAGTVFFLFQSGWDVPRHRLYLLLMNLLIGGKVFAGLSMIYLRFKSGGLEEEE